MTTVLYDGSCPLCSREIVMYQRQDAATDIEWLDVSQIATEDIPLGLSRESVLAQFHVIRADGTVAVGAAGFVALWRAFPKLRFLAHAANHPTVLASFEILYQLFLRARPLLQRAFIRGRKSAHDPFTRT